MVIENDYDENKYELPFLHVDNEIIKCCDIRSFINGIYHSDMQYLLPLYTKYYIINPNYIDLFTNLFDKREEFAYNNVPNGVCESKLQIKQHALDFYNKTSIRPYYKNLYYCLIFFIGINTYKCHEKYKTCFSNEFYGKKLKEIK